jgi:hypothetical protein
MPLECDILHLPRFLYHFISWNHLLKWKWQQYDIMEMEIVDSYSNSKW